MSAADRIDLHVHTTFSDGEFSPLRTAEMALAAGLRAMAVTDHDTMEGLEGFTPPPGIEIIPGIERKAWWHDTELHILGYWGDWAWLKAHARADADRRARNAAIVEKLRADGIDISMEELLARKRGVVGRPHIGELLAEKGYFPNARIAFDEWLAEGKPYYAALNKTTVPDTAAELRAAGARVVLAHPYQYRFPAEELAELVRLCADSGFHGMEVYYSGYTPEASRALIRLAAGAGLTITGGSDFHGARRPERKLGLPEVPYALLEMLKEKE